MRVDRKDPPRLFRVGTDARIAISDVADVHLEANEQVTFVTEAGSRYDCVRKDWGFYATPSINRRLRNEGFRTALVKNRQGLVFVMLVERGKHELFVRYCQQEEQTVVEWLGEAAPEA